MLTLKLITEEKDRVVRGLEKKHFKNAQETIAGISIGTMTFISVVKELHPSIAAASSISFGMFLKNCISMKMKYVSVANSVGTMSGK